ncbi:MAG: sensor histidine kinase [Fidelibacterota bacterium]
MRKKHSLAYYIVIFIIVQVIWLSIAGLWISRFIINNVIFKKIGERYSAQIPDGGAVAMLIIGLSLLVLALAGMSMLFRFLNIQFNLARMYDIFIANITHELKTPITSMQISTDTLKSRKLDEETRQKFLNNIAQNTQKLKDLIDNVLVLTRLEQKLQIYNCKLLNASAFLTGVIDKTQKDFAVATRIENQLNGEEQIVFDETAFRHILKNLLENSVKYTLDGPLVNIKLESTKKWVVITYCDNGTGISGPMRRKVFRKFYRGENRNIPNVKGTGLGLFLVREILKYHGGKIKIMKQKKESGTCFRILLPRFGFKKTRYLNKLLD